MNLMDKRWTKPDLTFEFLLKYQELTEDDTAHGFLLKMSGQETCPFWALFFKKQLDQLENVQKGTRINRHLENDLRTKTERAEASLS